ncbi:hypothetical protein PV326_000422 [Microctonus aethiopoides]|nr:hypothetical protein PV326_000422 [Microctonus aethiopoides]
MKKWFTKGSSKQKDSQEDRSGGGYNSGSAESEHIYADPSRLLRYDFQPTDYQKYRRGGRHNSRSHESKHIYVEINGHLNIDLQPTDSQKYQSGEGSKSGFQASPNYDHLVHSVDTVHQVISPVQSKHIYETIPANLNIDLQPTDSQEYQSGEGSKSGSHYSTYHMRDNSLHTDNNEDSD